MRSHKPEAQTGREEEMAAELRESYSGTYGLARELGSTAMSSVEALWDREGRTFWRSTEHRRLEEHSGVNRFFPTVTFRCTEALLFVLGFYRNWLSSGSLERLQAFSASVLDHRLEELESTLEIDEVAGVHNPFTVSVYSMTVARISRMRGLLAPSPEMAVIEKGLAASVAALKRFCRALLAEDELQTHPFIGFHILKAVLALAQSDTERADEIFKKVVDKSVLVARRNIEILLAQYVLGKVSPSDAIALLFSGATLVLGGREGDEPYVLKSLEAGLAAQDSSGCWPLGRVVRIGEAPEQARIEISTYEIAFVVTEILRELGTRSRVMFKEHLVVEAISRVVLAARYAQRSLITIQSGERQEMGWCSDHPYGSPLIESWTTANVLQFCGSLYALLEDFERARILDSFQVVDPLEPDWPTWRRWEKYVEDSEPDDERPVLRYLERRLIEPITRDERGLPSAKSESVSALLFGPPGTSKTTIVKAVAHGLSWPLVLLSPGDFIENGLEYIEAQARSVFDRLQRLSRAVVLFDECDELFRDRKPSEAVEQTRGIAAFVTASMLPKLQELHDRGRVVFFICTNKFESLDPAIRRGGRIDHIIGVGPPLESARRRLILGQLELVDTGSTAGRIAEALAYKTERFSRSELVRACALLQDDIDLMKCEFEKGKKAVARVVSRPRTCCCWMSRLSPSALRR